MNYALVGFLVKALDYIPMGGYRTYVVNGVMLVLWIMLAAATGNWEIAIGFIGTALSSLFQRKATEAQSGRLIYLETLLEDLSRELMAKNTVDRQ